ncbi:glycosyltransferase family 2 protein [Photobacterium sp. SDRW27]|uniref:glycosyltransferase family 2 protein n=1 Tax=Photobacterium obscurum TaxID=2829490 RepID=UPI0022434149|nr:glycosyltransferase family A protein [Photobacterium obscurum]MCW8327897.1 glycosyltransferase family 2 protein [Photobacterium obscurum]
MDKVSVVIPTYNCLPYLPIAIGSVLSQDYKNIEITIVDDNSDDGTAEYLKRISSEHSNVHVITTSGVGAASARNLAIKQSKGRYIAFLDADDYWYPGKISAQLAIHQRNRNIALSFTNYDHLNQRYDKIIDCFSYWNQLDDIDCPVHFIENPLDEIFAHNIIGTSTVMIDKKVFEVLGGFNEKMTYCEDWQYWLKVCECFDIAALTKTYTGYLMRQGSITQTDAKRFNHLVSISKVIDDYQQNNKTISKKSISLARARLKEGYADYFRTRGDLYSALHYDLHSLLIDPRLRRIKNTLGNLKKILTVNKPHFN